MGFSSSNQKNEGGIMGEEVEADLDSMSSNSSGVYTVESSESDDCTVEDEVISPASTSPPPPPPYSSSSSASNSSGERAIASPLHDMSALMHQLPLKRGLSKYFQGKSQSFTSLSNVRSLEELAKPENPYNKKLKSWKSYGLLSLDQSHTSSSSSSSSRLPRANSTTRFITKKGSNPRGSCSSLSAKRTPSFIGNMPPISSSPPHGYTPFFA